MPLGFIYGAHILFWLPAAIRMASDRLRPPAQTDAPAVQAPQAAPGAQAALWAHMVGFFFLYFGIGRGVFGGGQPGLPWVGAALIGLGLGLFAWALWTFRSWRLLAKLDEGHQLCTNGPFAVVRHPIYAAIDLLAIGTAIWLPLPEIVLGAVLIAVVSDVRARLEERLLVAAFGAAYTAQMARVRRFVPGIY